MRYWPRPGVIALVQELYHLSEENRRFLHARLLPQKSAETVESTKRKLRQLLSTSVVFNNKFSHAALKRVIDQYAKASDDPIAIADLLLTDLDEAFQTFSEVGDDEAIVDHLYATLYRLHDLLQTVEARSLPPLAERLKGLAEQWGGEFGYGISDELSGVSAYWQERVSGQNAADE